MSGPRLQRLRDQINEVDRQLLALLTRRRHLVLEVAAYKSEKGMPVMQTDRVVEVLETRGRWAVESDLDPTFLRDLFQRIIDQSCRDEEKAIG